jgi:hypothetical protein
MKINPSQRVNQFICWNEVSLPLANVNYGELFFDQPEDNKIYVYKKTKNGNKLLKTLEFYVDLFDITNINIEPTISNFITFNP